MLLYMHFVCTHLLIVIQDQLSNSIVNIVMYGCLLLYVFVITDGSEKLSDNSPGAASVTSFESTEFANDFAGLSFEEQERLRAEWNQVS